MSSAAPRKVAILGGGISSITVALLLTEDPNWKQKFSEITVYQLGWRLGGKGATGRGDHDRIEEHGLHIWLGFYENAFRVIQKVYQELARAFDAPLATWQQAFSPHNFIGVTDNHKGHWHPCLYRIPSKASVPGDGSKIPSFEESFLEALQWLLATGFANIHDEVGIRILQQLMPFAYPNLKPATSQGFGEWSEEDIVPLLQEFVAYTDSRLSDSETMGGMRCLFLLMSTVATMLRGVVRDGITEANDLETLEDEDFSIWLRRHGALRDVYDISTNPFLRGMYDFAFAYKDGDVGQPLFSAGPALRTIYRMLLTYKGSIIYKMEAGMGDTIFAPAYDVLQKRGVKFKFFHKVKNLGLSADKKQIETIELGLQATLNVPHYDPLVEIECEGYTKKLRCWPAHPKYGNLLEGNDLSTGNINLESFWTEWPDKPLPALKKGTDFDIVVLGIPIGSIPYICGELLTASQRWRDMVAQVQTVATQAAQLWIEPTLANLGWAKDGPVLDAWIPPFNTWADMTNLLLHKRENWPPARLPQTLAYFCGPLEGQIAPSKDLGYPKRQATKVDANRADLENRHLPALWPHWQPRNHVVDRYTKPNIDPSERYVLSLPGSAQYRLKANESGFSNLVITGDWIRTRYNAGCIEAATWAGIQAANTILGRPLEDGIFY